MQNRKQIIGRNLAIIRKNIRLVNDFVGRHSTRFTWIPPEAGSIAMLNILTGQSTEDFCQDLLDKKQVLAIGSHLFNMPEPAIRLGLGRMGFPDALRELENLLSQ